MATLARHFRISRAARAARGAMRAPPLPTSDFVREFERWMLTCEDHLVHRLAMDMHADRDIEANPYSQGLKEKASRQLITDVLFGPNFTDFAPASRSVPLGFGRSAEQANARSVSEVDQPLELCVDGCERCLGNTFGGAFPAGLVERKIRVQVALDQRVEPCRQHPRVW